MKPSKKAQLRISEPCHENWNTMIPNEKGKFCASCAKSVIDFSAMSDAQVLKTMEQYKNVSVCGRFTSDQLERDMYYTQSVQQSMFSLRAVVLGASLSSFFALSSCAQETPVKMGEVAYVAPKLMGDTVLVDTSNLVQKGLWVGKVIDNQSNLSIKNFSIELFTENDELVYSMTYTDRSQFEIDMRQLPSVKYALITNPDYLSKMVILESEDLTSCSIYGLYEEKNMIMGKVMIPQEKP